MPSFKIFHTADNHFDSKRLDEANRCAEFIIGRIKDEKPDVFVVAGDLLNKNTMIDSGEYLSAAGFVKEAALHTAVVLLKGNHDPGKFLDIFKGMPSIYVLDEIAVNTINDIMFCSLPYVKVQEIADGKTVEDMYESGSDHIRERLKEWGSVKADIPKVLLGHIFIKDAVLGNSETISPHEVSVSTDELMTAGCDMYLLGHIHNSEQEIFEDLPIRYCGPHYRTNFGEKNQPVFFSWDTETCTPEPIAIPARDMFEFELQQKETMAFIKTRKFPHKTPGEADVKIILNIKESKAKLVKKDEIIKLFPLCDVKIVLRVEPDTKVRSMDIARVSTLTEKFKEWAKVKKVKTPKSLMDKVYIIQEGLDG